MGGRRVGERRRAHDVAVAVVVLAWGAAKMMSLWYSEGSLFLWCFERMCAPGVPLSACFVYQVRTWYVFCVDEVRTLVSRSGVVALRFPRLYVRGGFH